MTDEPAGPAARPRLGWLWAVGAVLLLIGGVLGAVYILSREGVNTPLSSCPPWTEAVPLCDRAYLPIACELVENCTFRVHVAMMSAAYQAVPSVLNDLLDALARAKAAGADVKVVLEGEMEANAEVKMALLGRGVPCRLDSTRGFIHTKLVVADDRVIIGSHNWGDYALTENTEASLLVDDPVAAQYYDRYVLSLWEDSGKPADLGSSDSNGVTCFSGPGALRAYLGEIEAATETLDLALYTLAYSPGSAGLVPDLLSALAAAKDRGVTVRVLLDRRYDNDPVNNQAYAHLLSEGVSVRLDSDQRTMHAKILIRDGKAALVGDTNWASGFDSGTHTASVVVRDPRVASYLAAYFDRIWNEGEARMPIALVRSGVAVAAHTGDGGLIELRWGPAGGPLITDQTVTCPNLAAAHLSLGEVEGPVEVSAASDGVTWTYRGR